MNGKTRDIRPLLLLVFLNVLGVLALIIKESIFSYEIAVLSAIMCAVALVTYVIVTKREWGDPYLFVIVSMISTIGIVILARLANTGNREQNAGLGITQIKMYLVGVAAYFVTFLLYRMFNKALKKWTLLYAGAAIGLMVITLILGDEVNGAKNWIDLGFIMVQPSEFIRILFVMTFAGVLTKNSESLMNSVGEKTKLFDWSEANEKKKKWIRLIVVACFAAVCAACLVIQNELGTILVFGGVYIAFLCVYGESRSFLVLNVAVILIFMIVVVPILVDKFPSTATDQGKLGETISKVTGRIEAWQDPLKHTPNPVESPESNGIGVQVTMSLIAIGNGGLTGSGINNGAPYYVPNAPNDGIFAAVCEEFGLMGGIGLLMLYFLLVYRGFKISLSTTNSFNKAVSMGLSVIVGIQTFVIVGGITGLIPLTGITLPFVSAGGSSMISTFMIIGILQAISSMKGETTDELE